MFPRSYLPAAYFPPGYFPSRQGETVNEAPIFIGNINDISVLAGYAIAPVDVSVFFSDADALVFSAVGVWPAGFSISPAGVITGAPALNESGIFTDLSVLATDPASLQAESNGFTISIRENVAPQVISAPSDIVGSVGFSISPVQVSALFNDPFEAITYAIGGSWPGRIPTGLDGGSWIDPTTGTVSGRPDAPGIYAGLYYIATDASGQSTNSDVFTFTVSADALPPQFVGPEFEDVFGRQYIDIEEFATATAFETAGSAPVYSIAGHPPGISIDADTGIVSGRPERAGEFGPVSVRVTDESSAYVDSPGFYFYIAIRRHTFRDIVVRALERCGRTASGNAASGEEIEDGLEILRDMLEAWRDQGIDFGVIDEQILLDNEIMVDRGAYRAIISCLAVDIAIDAGLPIAPQLERQARQVRSLLMGRMIRGRFSQLDEALMPSIRYHIDEN